MADNREHTEALDLDKLRKLCDGATPGPWRAFCDGGGDLREDILYIDAGSSYDAVAVTQNGKFGHDPCGANANFIAAARSVAKHGDQAMQTLQRAARQ